MLHKKLDDGQSPKKSKTVRNLRSILLGRKIKVTLYKTKIRPVMLYECSRDWVFNKRGRELLGASGSRVLRKIVGHIKDCEVKRLPYNRHFYTCTVTVMKTARLRWPGLVIGISDSEMPKTN